MTISLERPLFVAEPAATQHCLVDPYDEPHAQLSLRALVSRDQLAAAVTESLNSYDGERHPDTWTVDEVRYHAEFQILMGGVLELQAASEAMARQAAPDYGDREAHEYALAVYRAVDRAFPNSPTCEG